MRAAILSFAAAVYLIALLSSVRVDAAPQARRAAAPARTPATVYQDVYNGWKWWHVYCFRCHGQDAVATTNAPNLSDPAAEMTPRDFLKVVRDGLPEQGMQAWSKMLDNKQIGQIHLYVRARTDGVLKPGRPDEVGPNGGKWVPPAGWPK